jgi:hypothetical protein
MVDVTIPFAPCSELDPETAVSGSGIVLSGRLSDPAYQRLMDGLRQLFRSME